MLQQANLSLLKHKFLYIFHKVILNLDFIVANHLFRIGYNKYFF